MDWGTDAHDIGILSQVTHALSPTQNREVFSKFRKALRPGGTLLVVDFMLADDRTGPPMSLLFHSNMLVHTAAGAPWRIDDLTGWLREAGFGEVEVDTGTPPVGMIYARA